MEQYTYCTALLALAHLTAISKSKDRDANFKRSLRADGASGCSSEVYDKWAQGQPTKVRSVQRGLKWALTRQVWRVLEAPAAIALPQMRSTPVDRIRVLKLDLVSHRGMSGELSLSWLRLVPNQINQGLVSDFNPRSLFRLLN